MKAFLAILLLCIAILQPAEALHAACSCNWLCIEPSGSGERRGLIARNASEVPLTFTVQFDTRKYLVDGPSMQTRTLAPGSTVLLPAVEREQGYGDDRGAYRCDWTIGNMAAIHDESLLYMLPYEAGKSYRVLQGFGSRFSHTGTEQYAVDFKMREGTPVHAARSGLVASIEESNSRGCWRDECAGHANYIVILHDDETTGEYYHLQQNGALVQAGERVVAGQKIGLSGNTGHSTMPHLHFGVYRAVSRGKEQSVPFRFLSADGIVDQPRHGGMYVAVEPLNHEQRASTGQALITGH